MAFLHGIETIEVNSGPRPIQVVRAAVVGLIGIAPKGPLETCTVVNNDVDAAQFGAELDGFTIPQALNSIFAQGAGTVIVVNVFNPDTMTATVTAEEQVVASQRIQLDFAPIGETITLTGTGGTPTYTAGTQYTVDEFGLVSILDTATILNGATVEATYEKLDASTITSSTIIGAVSGANVRTGLKAFGDAFSLFGFEPTIFIAPKYVETSAVATGLIATAESFRGFALIDAPVGTTQAVAIAGRGPLGTINFFTGSKNAVLLYPHLKRINPKTDTEENVPYSQYFAGVWCDTISRLGYQYSPSNKPINGIVGLEQPVSFNPTSASTDANALNAAGIVTVGQNFGTGLITWGNRSAAYPTSTAPDNFMAVLMTAYIIDKSIEQASLQFVDQPLNNALIDSIVSSANAFLRSLIARGAIIDGSVTFPTAKNSNENLALGRVTFDVTFMPPTPAERITYDRFIDISLLAALTA
jgi:uncharacterized protein